MIAQAEISASIYRELRKLAAAKMRSERDNHTLQPTALVHEAYLRLADQPDSVWKDRGRILGLAAQAMRHILVDHARARATEKRGAGTVQISVNEGVLSSRDSFFDVLTIDEALSRLSAFDSRQAKVLELHFFGGLSIEEIAQELKISPRTIARDWAMARAWLRRQLTPKT
jgi:RNA polymerase sigma-70 factor (ECF subfamily)